jgi:hypothetical protein
LGRCSFAVANENTSATNTRRTREKIRMRRPYAPPHTPPSGFTLRRARSDRVRNADGNFGHTLRVGTKNGANLNAHKWIGSDGMNIHGSGWGGGDKSRGAQRHAMSGLDGGTGNYSTSDGSVKQGDDAQWTAALQAAAQAKGEEFPEGGNVSIPRH